MHNKSNSSTQTSTDQRSRHLTNMAEVNGGGPDQDTVGSQASKNQTEPSTQPVADTTNHSFPPQSDSGSAKRPRDARVLHMILASYGVNAYQERVPLQLMDFAYRYTSSILQDSLHLMAESYGTTGSSAGSNKDKSSGDSSGVTLSAIRLSTASRTHYQFNPSLPKEFYIETAQERNRIALPPVSREWGARLPPEQYCLTGTGWDLKEEYDEDMEDTNEGRDAEITSKEDGIEVEDADEGDDEGGRMEDLFGADNDGDMEE